VEAFALDDPGAGAVEWGGDGEMKMRLRSLSSLSLIPPQKKLTPEPTT
jgi:hypothetical protein